MDQIRIKGGTPLKGTIKISGAKNAALPLMTVCLLTDEPVILRGLPQLKDIASMCNLLAQLGVRVTLNSEIEGGHSGRIITFHANDITSTTAPYELVRQMRASNLVLGPLLARFGEAKVSLPGGCAIGTRPMDLHIDAMRALGATVDLSDGYVVAKVKGRLKGGVIDFAKVSVGATENALTAAVLADGKTTIKNAAKEPEIIDLCQCLISMGAKIEGVGTEILTIEGVQKLHGTTYTVMPDRIEAGTYAFAAAMTRGDVVLKGAPVKAMSSVIEMMRSANINVEVLDDNTLHIKATDAEFKPITMVTDPYPGFPTDLQAQLMALMTTVDGESHITETIFENRFMHVPELARMGADIRIDHSIAKVKGVAKLKGAEVMATDIRASVCLVVAGLAAVGETVIHRVYHLDRGYEQIEEKLKKCGADISRVTV